ncbi:MAG: ABC transporter ATP-binding protein, partial [Solirubrobacterales bacterium]
SRGGRGRRRTWRAAAGVVMLIVDRVNSSYGRSHVLHDVSLRVEPGEVVVLLGRNGAGKTTTMASVVGFVRTRSGTIRLGSERIDRLSPYKRVRAGLGYVPQSGRVFAGLTVLENLEMVRGRAASNGDGYSVERVFGLFPKLADLAARDAGHLSGGERQMLAVARALMANPAIVLFDEPSEGLAPVVVERLGELIAGLRGAGVGVLLAEQNHRFALRLADRGYFIEKGQIRHHGGGEDLSRSDVLERFLGV